MTLATFITLTGIVSVLFGMARISDSGEDDLGAVFGIILFVFGLVMICAGLLL